MPLMMGAASAAAPWLWGCCCCCCLAVIGTLRAVDASGDKIGLVPWPAGHQGTSRNLVQHCLMLRRLLLQHSSAVCAA